MRTIESEMRKQLRDIDSVRALPDIRHARCVARTWWRQQGFADRPSTMLTAPESQAKLGKTGQWSLTLAPAGASGMNACPFAGACIDPCVMVTAGKGSMPNVVASRIARSQFIAAHPQEALAWLRHDIMAASAHGRRGFALRLNAASDIRWETVAPWWLESLPKRVRLYDYTKWPIAARMRDIDALARPYALCRSIDETQESLRDGLAHAANGGSAAVVLRIRRHDIPATFHGLPTVDGDAHDDRTDPSERGHIVVLAAKGSAVHDTTGFVRAPVA